MSMWERFNNIEGATNTEVEEAKSLYDPIEEGMYNVRVEEFMASESKTGLPMVKGKFRVIDGKRKNSIIFYNQVIQNPNYPNLTAQNIAKVMGVVSGLLGEEIEFTNLVDLEKTINQIEDIEALIEVYFESRDVDKKFAQVKVINDDELPFV